MVNSEEFIVRLERILSFYNLSAAAFADNIGVQRSSISHLLTGRNKPSLEFVMKVVRAYPDINLYWLLNGKGSFPSKKEDRTPPPTQISEEAEFPETKKEIKRILVLYKDGSFEAFDPNTESDE
jgi:transcriptional regulator with XRE-family HTH domain